MKIAIILLLSSIVMQQSGISPSDWQLYAVLACVIWAYLIGDPK